MLIYQSINTALGYTGIYSPNSRSIWPVETNQYNITIATHSNIIMGNDVATDIHCDVTMSNDINMCTYHGITMHKDVAMSSFYDVFSAVCLIEFILLSVVTSSCLISLSLRTLFLFVCRATSLILHTHETSLHKHNSFVLHSLIKHSLVLVI